MSHEEYQRGFKAGYEKAIDLFTSHLAMFKENIPHPDYAEHYAHYIEGDYTILSHVRKILGMDQRQFGILLGLSPPAETIKQYEEGRRIVHRLMSAHITRRCREKGVLVRITPEFSEGWDAGMFCPWSRGE